MFVDVNRCRICGDSKRLDADGVCEWRAGCDHRVEAHEAEMSRLTAQLANNDPRCACGWNHGFVRGVVQTLPTPLSPPPTEEERNRFATFFEAFEGPVQFFGGVAEWGYGVPVETDDDDE